MKPKEISGCSNIKDLFEKLNISLTGSNLVDFVENFDCNLKIRRQWWEEEDQLTIRHIKEFIEELDKSFFSRISWETKEGEIVLSTIHGSKGLEFDYVFLVDVNEEILPSKKAQNAEEEEEERSIFYVGITRSRKKLYLCSSNQEKISQFITKLDPKLIKIVRGDLDPKKINHPSPPYQKKEEIIGEEGEEKVYDLLIESKISFLKLVKNWEEIPNLQIDIYAETTQMVYFIEVKNWSWDTYSRRKEEVLEQQSHREKTIIQSRWGAENNKKFTYIICFFYWKMAQDFRDFYQQIEGEKQLNKERLLFAFYEEPDDEFTFFANSQIQRIGDWAREIETKYDTK